MINKASIQYLLNKGEKTIYHFERFDDDGNFIRMRHPMIEEEDGRLLPIDQIDSESWSHKFEIDDIGDFQVIMRCSDDDVKQVNHRHRAWYLPSHSNSHRRFLRVFITTEDEATIFIMLFDPNMPDLKVVNYTHNIVKFSVKDNSNRIVRGELFGRGLKTHIRTMKKRDECRTYEYYSYQPTSMSFLMADSITLEIGGSKKDYKIESIKCLSNFKVGDETYLIAVTSTGYYRQLEIKSESREKKIQEARKQMSSDQFVDTEMYKQYLDYLMTDRTFMDIKVNLKGLGVSIVDNEPKEILYLSIFKIKVDFKQENIDRKLVQQVESKIESLITIDHMQIDNMTGDENPIIFTPMKAIDRSETISIADERKHELLIRKDEEKNKNYKPFIMLKCNLSSSERNKIQRQSVEDLEFEIAPVIVEIETGILSIILSTIMNIMDVFTQDNFQYLTANTTQDNQINLRDSAENANKLTIEEHKQLREELLEVYPDLDIPEGSDLIFEKSIVCDEVGTEIPNSPDPSELNTDRMYFERLRLEKIKLFVTFRFEKQELNFDIKRGFGILTILYTFLTSIANVSKVPLKFDRFKQDKMFCSQDQLIAMIGKRFARQAFFQFYKIFMSTDLLGNPLGLFTNVTDSFLDFFKESHKSMKDHGCCGLCVGPCKGCVKCCSGLVAGCSDSLGTMTGSCYGISKSISGQSSTQNRPAYSVCQGARQIITGSVEEVYNGVVGIVEQPYIGCKRNGPCGMVQGVGKGICGFVMLPLSCVLRACNNCSQGVNGSALSIKTGNVPKLERFRYARHITIRHVLVPYEEEVARADRILQKIQKGKYAKQNVRYFAKFKIYKNEKPSKTDYTLIITQDSVLFCKDEKTLINKFSLNLINKVEVYKGREDVVEMVKLYHIYVWTKNKRVYKYETIDYTTVNKIFNILNWERQKADSKL